jgi:transposase InsO family protein
MGFVFLHACVDDNSRYAYLEQHPDQRAETAAAFLRRALEHLEALGLAPPEAVMSDNGNAYRSRPFRAELDRIGARQILTPPYTPRWNGKVERFFQTLKREWAYAHTWPNSAERSRALRSYLRYYNRRRPHSSLGDRPPISRVHNVHGQNS